MGMVWLAMRCNGWRHGELSIDFLGELNGELQQCHDKCSDKHNQLQKYTEIL